MPCIILSTLWKKTCTVYIRTWFQLDQIICITVKYEVGILIIFSLCCFFSPKHVFPQCVLGVWGSHPPRVSQERETSCDSALLTSERSLWEAISSTRIWLAAESQQLLEQLLEQLHR